MDPAVPLGLARQVHLPAGYRLSTENESAPYTFGVSFMAGPAYQVYLLAAPFFTLTDDLSRQELEKIWSGEDRSRTLIAPDPTWQVFSEKWGAPAETVRRVQSLTDVSLAPDDSHTLLLIPFEDIRPEWKILTVDGVTPLTHPFEPASYPLTVYFSFQGKVPIPAELQAAEKDLTPNYDPQKLSIVAMTGTTALTRATAHEMDIHGVTWPARDIGQYLRDADLTHISNEVSFYAGCSKGNPNEKSMMFCSRPEYLELLQDVGADVIELSGNHNLDYGKKPYLYSLDLYQQVGMKTYAGGLTEEDARKPLLLEDHGNRFAFLGCNFVGPTYAMATENSMGAAHCDFEWFASQLTALRQQGYLPIFTFQYSEYYIHKPGEHQERDYKRMVDAGAVVVSGSQAHYPQVMTIYRDSFIHYGLGNLFFDQMDRPIKGTREEFIDRHYFYDGRYIGTQLITALLEEYARPRSMTAAERIDFLTRIFADAVPASPDE